VGKRVEACLDIRRSVGGVNGLTTTVVLATTTTMDDDDDDDDDERARLVEHSLNHLGLGLSLDRS
jgi:hypothetical protein